MMPMATLARDVLHFDSRRPKRPVRVHEEQAGDIAMAVAAFVAA